MTLGRFTTAVVLAMALSTVSGCATMFSDGNDRLEVNVRASGADSVLTTVQSIDDGTKDTRSDRHFEVEVSPTSNYVVVSSGEGMGHTVKILHSEVNPAVWTNFGWAVTGMIVSALSPTRKIDANTGAVLSTEANGSYFAAGLVMTFLGFGIDYITDQAWRLERRRVEMVLKPQPTLSDAIP